MRISKTASESLAVVAVVAATAVSVSLLSAGAPVGASTTACGPACASPSVELLGAGDVLTVSGNSVVISAASTTSSAQDWTVMAEGNVTGAVSAGVVSQKLMLNYYDSDLVEFEYAPSGIPSDKCMADTASDAAVNDYTPPIYVPTTSIALEPCGMTAASLWIVDQSNALSSYDDLINAGYEAEYSYLAPSSLSASSYTSPFAEPYVLTASANSSGSGGTVALAPLSELGGNITAGQAWTAYTAPDQSALRAAIKSSAEKSSEESSR